MGTPITAISRHLRSICCEAPLLQVYEFAPLVYLVLCSRCYEHEAGSPSAQDLDRFATEDFHTSDGTAWRVPL